MQRIPLMSDAHLAVVRALAAYTGRNLWGDDVEVYADPRVDGLYAAQLAHPRGRASQFVVRPLAAEMEQVEEAQFTSWPPSAASAN